jgi:DNA-binding NarL/FixJ family response regulator
VTNAVANDPAADVIRLMVVEDHEAMREGLELLLGRQGCVVVDAAAELFLSPLTVRTHVRNAMRKLEAHTRVHAITLALQQGEIEI